MSLGALDGIAAAVGPGSFTGLRIAVSAAQGLAFGAGLPVAGVSTLEALAWGLIDRILPAEALLPGAAALAADALAATPAHVAAIRRLIP